MKTRTSYKPHRDHEAVVALAAECHPTEISRRLNIPRGTVYHILYGRGLKAKVDGRRAERHSQAHAQIRLVAKENPDLNNAEIGRRCGCSRDVVRHVLGGRKKSGRAANATILNEVGDGDDGRLRLERSANVDFLTALCRNEAPPASLTIKPTAPVLFPRAEIRSVTGSVWE